MEQVTMTVQRDMMRLGLSVTIIESIARVRGALARPIHVVYPCYYYYYYYLKGPPMWP